MSTPSPLPSRSATVLRNLRRLQVAAVIIGSGALGATLADSLRLAIALIVAALLLNIISIEAIRVVVASQPEPRR